MSPISTEWREENMLVQGPGLGMAKQTLDYQFHLLVLADKQRCWRDGNVLMKVKNNNSILTDVVPSSELNKTFWNLGGFVLCFLDNACIFVKIQFSFHLLLVFLPVGVLFSRRDGWKYLEENKMWVWQKT